MLAALALAPALVAHLLEQDVAQLLGAADGERLPRQRVDFRFQPGNALGEIRGQPGQCLAVDLDARALHAGNHRDQRPVHAFIDAGRGFLRQARLQYPVQAPGDFGIFGGIAGRLVERHFSKGNGLLAGTAQVLVGDAGMAKVAPGQLVHAMAGHAFLAAAGVEIERDHHGIVDRSHGNAVPREQIDVVLGVLPDLEHRRRFEQRLEPRERRLAIDLPGPFGKHVAPAVGQRDIARLTGPGAQADPDQFGPDRIERRGFGIEGDQPRGKGAFDPAIKRSQVLHAFIGIKIDVRHFRQGLARGTAGRRGSGRDRFCRIELGRRRGAAGTRAQAPQQAGEAMRAEERRQRLGRNGIQLEGIQRHRQFAVLPQLHQHAGEPRHVRLIDQAFAQLGRLHRRCRGQGRFQAAVFLDQLGRGFRTDAADAGHVVHRIAHQRQHVAHQFGGDAELGDHFRHVDPLVLHRIEHVDAGFDAAFMRTAADQLHQVLVGRNDGHVPAPGRGGARIGGDQVIRFQPRHFDALQGKGAGRIADQRELGHQVFGRWRAIGLVLIVDVVAEGHARCVENHAKVSRAVCLVQIVRQFPQHGGIAIDRANRRSLRVRQRWKAVIGTENIGRTVNEVEMLPGLHRLFLAAARRAVSPCPGAEKGAFDIILPQSGPRRRLLKWPAPARRVRLSLA